MAMYTGEDFNIYQDWQKSKEFNDVVLSFYNNNYGAPVSLEAGASFDQGWHSSRDFNSAVLNYHTSYGRQPHVTDAKARLEQLKEDIRNQMNRQGVFQCMGFAHKGSTYERVKIPGDCPEFDLDFIIKGGDCLRAEKAHSSNSFYELKVCGNYDSGILWRAQDCGVMSPTKVMQFFHGSLVKCEFVETYNVKIRYHGPAVQLDVHHPGTNQLWFQVDLAPAFYVPRYDGTTDCFIAKLSNDESLRCLWYKSHALDEKDFYEKAAGQRKVVLRILKAMRKHSNQLSALQTYDLKLAHTETIFRYKSDRDWDVSMTGQRLVDVLRYIHTCLDDGQVANRLGDMNRILDLSPHARTNLKNYIGGLLTNKLRMYQLLRYSA